MSDEETSTVEHENAQAVGAATEAETSQERQPEEKPKKKQQNAAEYNWAEANRLIKQRGDEVAQLKAQLDQIQKQQKPPEDDLARLSPDDILTVAQAEKLMQQRAARIAEEVVKQREAATVDERLANKYNDYQTVVSRENIEVLKQQEPELAMSLWKLADDPYAQGVAAYKLIKKLGIGEEDMADKKKAVENSKKPVSVQSVTNKSAIGNAHLFENGLTKELKSQLWKEMQEAAKRM